MRGLKTTSLVVLGCGPEHNVHHNWRATGGPGGPMDLASLTCELFVLPIFKGHGLVVKSEGSRLGI